jgi:hypothetical protein
MNAEAARALHGGMVKNGQTGQTQSHPMKVNQSESNI